MAAKRPRLSDQQEAYKVLVKDLTLLSKEFAKLRDRAHASSKTFLEEHWVKISKAIQVRLFKKITPQEVWWEQSMVRCKLHIAAARAFLRDCMLSPPWLICCHAQFHHADCTGNPIAQVVAEAANRLQVSDEYIAINYEALNQCYPFLFLDLDYDQIVTLMNMPIALPTLPDELPPTVNIQPVDEPPPVSTTFDEPPAQINEPEPVKPLVPEQPPTVDESFTIRVQFAPPFVVDDVVIVMQKTDIAQNLFDKLMSYVPAIAPSLCMLRQKRQNDTPVTILRDFTFAKQHIDQDCILEFCLQPSLF